mgnify:CR=1 FL=1
MRWRLFLPPWHVVILKFVGSVVVGTDTSQLACFLNYNPSLLHRAHMKVTQQYCCSRLQGIPRTSSRIQLCQIYSFIFLFAFNSLESYFSLLVCVFIGCVCLFLCFYGAVSDTVSATPMQSDSSSKYNLRSCVRFTFCN